MTTKLELFLSGQITKNDLNIGLEFHNEFGKEIINNYELIKKSKPLTKNFKIISEKFKQTINLTPNYEKDPILHQYNAIIPSLIIFQNTKITIEIQQLFNQYFRKIQTQTNNTK